MNKLHFLAKSLFDRRLKSDLRALMLAKKGYTFYAWKLCEQSGISALFESGITIDNIVAQKNIKNLKMLESLLGFLVGESILKFRNGVYTLNRIPKNFSVEEEQFVIENYEDSNTWTLLLFEHSAEVLVHGKRATNTGFENEKFSKLWDGVMLGPLYSLRKIAIDKTQQLAKNSSSVADLGCGSGTFAVDFALTAKKGTIIDGFDASREMLDIAKKRASEITSPAKLTFLKKNTSGKFDLGKKYDLIFSSLLINHIKPEDRMAFFESVSKSMNPDGKFIIFQLVNKSENKRIFSDWLLFVTPTHFGFPFSSDYRKCLKKFFRNVDFFLDDTIVIASNPIVQVK